MLTSLSLPALATLLINIPGLGILPGFKVKLPHKPAFVDTLPPAWKPASRLALENRFVLARLSPLGPSPVALKLLSDPRQLDVALDSDSGAVSAVARLGDVTLEGTRVPLGQFAQELTRLSFEKQWEDRSRQSINSRGAYATGAESHTGLSLQLPSPLPRRVQSLLGPGGPALNVSGSENISLSGQSNWSNQQIGPLGQKKSLFPSLDMQQNLDIRLEGQLSDRIRVNLLQNSTTQIPLANRIAINYKGDEDDLVQQLDLGNTNLSLPATQYVSYGGKNEGLFGIKAASKVGPLDVTVLASKQEGRSERASYAGGSSRQIQTLKDLDYVKGVYFFLYDPNGRSYDIPDASINVYLDDGNYSSNINRSRGRAVPFKDNGDAIQTQLDNANRDSLHASPGRPDSTTYFGHGTVSVRGSFRRLESGPDRDYEILHDVYGPTFKVIRLKRQITGEQRLACTYQRRPVDAQGNGVGAFEQVGGDSVADVDSTPAVTMKLLRPPSSLLTQANDGSGNFDDRLAVARTRELELKNFYQLPGQRIDPGTLKISIRRGTDNPPVTFVNNGGIPIPYIEVLGLDNFDETTGTPQRSHDGKVDGTLATSNSRLFVDYENGTLFFFDLRPFAPRLGRGDKPFEQALSNLLSRRDSLTGPPEASDGANTAVYDKFYVQDFDARYYIDVDFTAARLAGEITLGRTNIIEGSDVVTINGQALARDRDYTIDYDLGRVTLKRQLGPADQLNVDYSYAPLFQQAGRTLLGSAFRWEGRDRSFGGAFMYESKGAQDLRPRLGEEPSRSLIADLNTDWAFKPEWLTRAVDKLPGVRTTTPSEFRVTGEMGSSFPNPNTRNEVYIDDMEGVRDAVSLSLDPVRWRWSSVPSRPFALTPSLEHGWLAGDLASLLDSTRVPHLNNAELHWYSPYAVTKEKDLKPNLSQAEGGDNNRSVLALSIPKQPAGRAAPVDSMWIGLTYPLDQAGLDLSQSQFIELWVNDFNDSLRVRASHTRLHIDLGVVSEDEMRAPNIPPDGLLDSEDREPRDQQLQVADHTEDTGLDGKENADEGSLPAPDLVTAGPADPQGDDWHQYDAKSERKDELNPRNWLRINGTEGNKELDPYPDTEDLNLNNQLDTQESYFEYTIDLGDFQDPYLVTDVQRDFHVGGDNGWRRYRIPIADDRRVQFGAPNLTLTRQVRVWVEGLVEPDPDPAVNARPILELGGLDIVGSRWRAAVLDSAAIAAGSTLTLNSVNTQDNADIYKAPFDPGRQRNGSQELSRREQSIALEFTRIEPRDSTFEAFKNFSIEEDYSRYGKLDWYVTGFDVTETLGARSADSLDYFVRFASDERGENYYEYRSPLPSSGLEHGIDWQEVSLDLTELSSLKLDPRFPQSDPIYFKQVRPGHPSDTLIVRGRPSFTRLRRISVGLANLASARTFASGQLWFNELRATDVAKDAGRAQRVQVSGRMANLFQYSLGWNGRDADFLSVGENRGTGNSVDGLSLSGSLDLHRFFEATGIVLPVSFNFSQNRSRPRFTAGDDVVRSGAQSAASETFGDSRSWSASYSRNWSDRSNPFLRYTIGGITANANTQNAHNHGPTGADRGRAVSGTVNYNVAPRSLLAIGLPGTKLRIFPLPERFFWNYSVDSRSSQTADRNRDNGQLIPRSSIDGRAARVSFGADTRPVELFHHHFEGLRNLALPGGQVGFINFGRMVSWNQTMDSRYALNRGTWLRPQLSWNSRYAQDNGPEISPALDIKQINNGQSVNMKWDFPFDGLVPRAPGIVMPAGEPGGRSPADSARSSASKPATWRALLSRLGTISTDGTIDWSSSYSRLSGIPNFFYLAGVSGNPGIGGSRPRMSERFGNQSTRGFNWRGGAHGRLALGLGATIQTQAELSSRLSNTNQVERREDSSRFPDLTVDYGRVADALQLKRVMQNPRLRTAYNRSQTVEYVSRNEKSRIATSSQWQPMLGLAGDLKNGTRLEMSVERRNTRTEALQFGSSITNDRNTDVNLSVNRSYSQGQKVNFLGRESTVRSSVNLGLTAVYSRQSGETIQTQDQRTLLPVKNDRLSLNGTGSYGFSSNVTGNLVLGFGQDRDLVRDIIHRNVRVELRASFTF